MGSISESVPNIIDIRSDSAGFELKKLIKDGLREEEKTLPTLLLYNNEGLKLFEEITYLDEYYLTGQEIAVLEKHAEAIAERIPQDAILLELGSGNLRKVKILLDALERAQKRVSYYALDLMHSELVRTLAAVPLGTFKHVQCFGLHGTYDDGLEWLGRSENAEKPKAILSMGSSIGNFNRSDAVHFVAQFADILKPNDTFILGLDACQDPETVYHAYNDKAGVTHDFIMNGLKHANELLGHEAFKLEDWKVEGVYDQVGERHRAFVIPQKDLEVEGISLRRGEKVRIEESYKYNHDQAVNLFTEAGVIEGARWANDVGTYALHMLSKPTRMNAAKPEVYAANPVPGLDEWAGLWELWDKVTLQMIPTEELYDKPIKLRNACIFYLGHIPTFFDMKLCEATGMEPAEPKYFHNIFERGIDPDVDNPELCHAHSEVPDSWPELDVILEYQRTIRNRIEELYRSGKATSDNWTGRALWLGFEHEVQHLETLLYMLIQSDKTLPPENVVKPDFEQMAVQAKREAVPNQWFDIPEQTLTLGLDDPDTPEGPVRHFGWDIEKPKDQVKVPAFKAQARPISNGEYAQYLVATNQSTIPASWTLLESSENGANGFVNGEAAFHDFIHNKAVRTVNGAVPLKLALDWPISASYDELQGCAKYMGGRIPTMEEARSIYSYANEQKKADYSNALGKTIPAVNGHLVNNGVQETPPSKPSPDGSGIAASPTSSELFVDLSTANVGFKHWHPMPVTPNGNKLAGQGEMGGLWEWTSSVLEKREGYIPMKLYPAYSADFFDQKHNIVLGGSWATHPRFAGRKSVVNWYQRNYPYVWAGARLVKDN